MAEHTVFGASAPPWSLAGFDNGSPITTANAFYATTTPWYVVGARLYVPAGAPFPAEVTLGLRTAAYETLVDLSAPPLVSGVADVAPGWCTARWAPFLLSPVTVAWISLEGGSVYVYGEVPGIDPVRATDLSDLYLAEAGAQPRAAYRIGGDVTTASAAHYGFCLLVTDDPDAGTVWEVSGLAPATSAAQGAVTARRAVSGAAVAVSDAVGEVTARRAVSGAAAVVSGGVGSVAARRPVSGTAAVVSAAFGSVTLAEAPDPLPIGGQLVPLTPERGLSALTPRRGLEPA